MATLVNLNENYKILLAKKEALFVDLACKDWIASANKSIKSRGAFYVALSGGSTPQAIYREIVQNKKKLLDTRKIFLFWGDERNVSTISAESNYGQAMSILRELNIPEEQIFRMKVESPDGARQYQSTIESVVPECRFDMIMFGIGEDGHTLSLFPNTSALEEKKRLVVFNEVHQLETTRMTLTFPCVQQGRHLVVYVSGANKKDIVKTLLFSKDKESENFPIERIGTPRTPLFWILSPDTFDLHDFDSIPSIYKLDVL
ncbi:6-phosphogluconolactonase [Chlamydia sp. 17-3921]|uniref:6-phosphogluconolactonase n=1 Tax=Chlamydia sp. 17-3921 TaxID=2675798 RepID=UPI0019182D19|nr:6-phosphogluconolactonase [Chlamydia sp. 17-3921]